MKNSIQNTGMYGKKYVIEKEILRFKSQLEDVNIKIESLETKKAQFEYTIKELEKELKK